MASNPDAAASRKPSYIYGTGTMGWEPEPEPVAAVPDPLITIRRSVLTGIVSDLSCPVPQVDGALDLARKALGETRV